MKTFKILVVDDDDNITIAIQERLESEGYEVRRANGFEEGYLTSLCFRPDLILTDITMGRENGLERRKKRSPSHTPAKSCRLSVSSRKEGEVKNPISETNNKQPRRN